MRGTGRSRGSWRTRPRCPRVRAGQALSPVSDPVRAVPHEERGALRFTERAKTGSTLQVGGTRFLGCQHSRWPLPKFTAKARDQKRAAGGDRSSSGLTRKTRERPGCSVIPSQALHLQAEAQFPGSYECSGTGSPRTAASVAEGRAQLGVTDGRLNTALLGMAWQREGGPGSFLTEDLGPQGPQNRRMIHLACVPPALRGLILSQRPECAAGVKA